MCLNNIIQLILLFLYIQLRVSTITWSSSGRLNNCNTKLQLQIQSDGQDRLKGQTEGTD